MDESIQLSSNSFIATFDEHATPEALAEIAQITGKAEAQEELAPGVLLVHSSQSFAHVAHLWRERPPVFIRHICPVQRTVPLNGGGDTVAAITAAALQICADAVPVDQPFSVQTRVLDEVGFKPYDVNTAVARAVAQATGAGLDVRNPQQVVSVVCAGGQTSGSELAEATAYVGLSAVEDNLSDWAGGMRRFAREQGQVSRSEFKLLEALDVFGIELQPRGVALDLGAAPGGWTRVLRQHSLYVTAVDPGDLHPSIRSDSGVRRLKLTAEEYLSRGPDRFDLIVNDMRMDGRDSSRLMARYAEYLYADGQAIMTLKLPERNRSAVMDHSLTILAAAYDILGVKQLFHNRSEVTVHLKRHDAYRDGS